MYFVKITYYKIRLLFFSLFFSFSPNVKIKNYDILAQPTLFFFKFFYWILCRLNADVKDEGGGDLNPFQPDRNRANKRAKVFRHHLKGRRKIIFGFTPPPTSHRNP